VETQSGICRFDPAQGGWARTEVGVYEITVRPEDIDGLGHTNNRCYIDWCETAAWQHSARLGLALEDYRRLDRAMVVRHAQYDYIASTYRGEQLKVGTWLCEMSAVQMRRHFEIVRPVDAVVVARAVWHLVCIELSSGRARRLPEEFVRAYGRVEISSVR
jgi:acyl-CoA thioester hydrolase